MSCNKVFKFNQPASVLASDEQIHLHTNIVKS